MKVLDASVVVKFLTQEALSEQATAVIVAEADRIAPDILTIEVASALSKKVRYTGLPRAVADRAMRCLPDLWIELVPLMPLVDAAISLSIEFRHALYDCLYLALADGRDCSLVTADEKFVGAARASRFSDRVIMLGAESP